ncbi:MAG: hypothetical protein NTW99_06675 [Chloroflexi bacterium]|nr:hypothetical protein [Chloroflexota bacterium]
MMKTNYVEMHKSLEERLAQLGSEIPGPMIGFARLHKKAIEQGALSSKVKEMMALAISIVVGCGVVLPITFTMQSRPAPPARNYWKRLAWES